ncbi:tryptophan transporter [Clostridium niameyense]|uniref:Tryptophan transporter n=1 Tax=Clostridium niameyense TaxID=1622073 RepID=A0A6M0R6C4_9CLOT|nr:tryptophan transporter [Clostridium niameyense]NEZ45736.1 tryptophan transporter [Clostridium niameyense]
MNLKKMILSSLLLAMGLLLHQIAPPLLFGMKPDFLLIMMFITLILNKDYKSTLVIGILSGILTAFTTTFPGGQLPNIIDKIVTSNLLFFLIKATENKFNKKVKVIILSFIGTFISGSVFLGSSLLFISLPAPFISLVLSVVLPASIINTITTVILYNIINMSLRRSSMNI